jgi:hypothetical protein
MHGPALQTFKRVLLFSNESGASLLQQQVARPTHPKHLTLQHMNMHVCKTPEPRQACHEAGAQLLHAVGPPHDAATAMLHVHRAWPQL